MELQMSFELCSLLFLILFVIAAAVRRRSELTLSGNSGLMIMMIFLAEATELLTARVLQGRSRGLQTGLCLAVLLIQSFIPVLFGALFIRRRQNEPAKIRLIRLANLIPYAVFAASTAMSVWSRYVFYVDAHGFHQGKRFWIFYLNYLFYAVSALWQALRHKRHRRMQTPVMVVILLLGMLPAILAMLFPGVPLYCLCMTCIVFIISSSEGSAYLYTDSVSGALNREAFLLAIQDAEEHAQPAHVFAIGMDNFKLINEMYSVEGGNQLMRQIVSALQSEFSKRQIYRLGGDMFALIVPRDTECPKVLDTLRKLFTRPYKIDTHIIRISACIGIVHTEHHQSTEMVSALEFAVGQAKTIGKGEVFEIAENTADVMKRRQAIEKAMMDNIQERRFEVHYQPIYDTRKKRFHSMEALARLNVPGYGYVSPEEFIRIAEKNGTILEIGLLVLEEVCRFIKETDLGSKGIEYVEVNLSVVQCTQDSIYSSIRELLERYEIPAEMLNLELTESAAAYSEKKLIRNLARMSLMNLSFSLDDYGSGYSNINYIVTLPFSIAKIDKYVVWAAAKSAMSRSILEHTIAMFRDIHLKVVAEGIENAEMADMVTRMGADFIQGYYFSKPVPKDLLLERLEDSYLEKFRGESSLA